MNKKLRLNKSSKITVLQKENAYVMNFHTVILLLQQIIE